MPSRQLTVHWQATKMLKFHKFTVNCLLGCCFFLAEHPTKNLDTTHNPDIVVHSENKICCFLAEHPTNFKGCFPWKIFLFDRQKSPGFTNKNFPVLETKQSQGTSRNYAHINPECFVLVCTPNSLTVVYLASSQKWKQLRKIFSSFIMFIKTIFSQLHVVFPWQL